MKHSKKIIVIPFALLSLILLWSCSFWNDVNIANQSSSQNIEETTNSSEIINDSNTDSKKMDMMDEKESMEDNSANKEVMMDSKAVETMDDSDTDSKKMDMMDEKKSMEANSTNKEVMMDSKAVETMDDKSDVKSNASTISTGVYTEYSPEWVENAQGKIVLFFHADWCPACEAIDGKVKNAEIPNGVTILKVNYDNETELKKKYGVTTQTTFVQIDSEWNKIKKWFWARSLDDIINKLQ